MKKLVSILMAFAIIFASAVVGFPVMSTTVQAAGNGVQSQIDKLRAVYPTGSAFTVDGSHCNDALHQTEKWCWNCYLPNIAPNKLYPNCGLPSGAQVGAEAWGCASFAYYAFYYIYGHNHGVQTTQTNTSQPVFGDMIHMYYSKDKQHWFIYLGEDSGYYYVYDANYYDANYKANNQNVRYNGAIAKSEYIGYARTVYHATNYDQVNGSAPTEQYTYTSITPGVYYLKNPSSNAYLNVSYGQDANKQNVDLYEFIPGCTAELFEITEAADGYKMRPMMSSRLVQPYGDYGTTTSGMNVNIWDDVNDSTQWWYFQSVSEGYVIHNVANTSCVLTASEGNAIVSTYTGSSNQIWSLVPQEHTCNYIYTEKDANQHTRTCSVCGKAETTNHTWDSGVVTKPATCKENGTKTYTCTDCKATKTESIAKTNEHSVGGWTVIKEATLNEEGTRIKKCTICGKVLETEVIPKLTTYTSITPGIYYLKHRSSGTYLNVSYGQDANKQNIDLYEFISGCTAELFEIIETADGYKMRPLLSTSRVVSVWGSDQTSGANVNLYDDQNESTQWWKFEAVDGGYIIHNSYNPSCVLDCTDFNAIIYTRNGGSNQIWELIPQEHICNYMYTEKDANQHTRTCTVCGKVETANHTWDSGAVTKPATCKETGTKTYTCTVCKATKTESIAKTNDHSVGDWTVTKEATVNEEGMRVKKCTVCNKVLQTEVIPKLASSVVKGDINGNGIIDAQDCFIARRAFFRLIELKGKRLQAIDFNNNGVVDARECLMLNRAFFGLSPL